AGTASAGAVSAQVATLAEAGVKAFLVTKLKVVTAALLTLGLAGAGTLALLAGAAQPERTKPDVPPGATEGASVGPARDATPAADAGRKANLLVYRDGNRDVPIRSAADWEKRRAQILANMQRVLGPLPDASTRVNPDLRVESEEEVGTIVR